MSNINLDNLSPKRKTVTKEGETKQTTVPVGELGLTIVRATTPVAEELKKPAASRKLTDVYAALQKLVYLIDISGSMNDEVAGVANIEQFKWPDETMDLIKARAAEASNRITEIQAQVLAMLAGADDPEQLDIPTVSEQDTKWAGLASLEGDDLKLAFIRSGLYSDFGLRKDYSKWTELHTKIGLVKKMAAKEIGKRFEKYPDADVHCITFDTQQSVLPAATKEMLLESIGRITVGGGTHIYGAVEAAMKLCDKNPSSVNMHHIVLVTDGEDGSASQMEDLLPKMQARGVVLDFIYIKNPGVARESFYLESNVTAIKKVCAATNGSYTEVTNAQEFETKFVEAGARLLLPAPKGS